jgi:hypothetical protein
VFFETHEVTDVYERFSALADKKKNIYDQDLLAIVPDRSPVAIAA